ncbi:hypothetical protein [Halobacillus sp. BBL2006]|uniref:hypothetical protein n=1 Tax=Halobacillus sp. BBL2006 TaxID=1543706 RepID=UPI000AD723EC|nr:hypothetical protein [Halobacillus sp. BBL2006]
MEGIIFYLSPVIGFVFMLTLIMAFVRMAGGHPVQQKHKRLLVGSFVVMIGMIVYVSII